MYTERQHVKGLLRILEQADPCLSCPNSDVVLYKRNCVFCRKFIGLPGKLRDNNDKWCPCLSLGEEESIKRTWLTLEEKGYI